MLDSWLFAHSPRPAARQRLLCLPFAGGGASAYRDWQRELPLAIELCAVQLPGRETRIADPPIPRVHELVPHLVDLVARLADRPYAIFGHSMGALITFELARAIRRRGLRMPTHLFVSAHVAPDRRRNQRIRHSLPDDELKAELRALGGTPEMVLENQELWQLLWPAIRADFALCETYAYAPEPPLSCPIVALGGLSDDTVPEPDLEAWSEHTTARFQRRMFPGRHFYLFEHRAQVARLVAAELLAEAAPQGG